MCSNCKHVLRDFIVKHPENQCILKRSQYCTHCASYGHLTRDCKSTPPEWAREPCFVEQLVQYHDLKKYNITSKTAFPLKLHESEIDSESKRKCIRIHNNVAGIKGYLYNTAGISSRSKSKDKLKKIVMEHIDEKRIRIQYVE